MHSLKVNHVFGVSRAQPEMKLAVKVTICAAIVLVIFLIMQARQPNPGKVQLAFMELQKCHLNKTLQYEKNYDMFWKHLSLIAAECREKSPVHTIEMTPIRNADEIKYHIFSDSSVPSVVLTLGIGADTKVEEYLKEKLPEKSEFYGADPVLHPNAVMFEKIGTFFPLAVSKFTGRTNSMIRLDDGTYKPTTMTNVNISLFMTEMVKRNVIDQFLLDNEGPEYDIFPMLAEDELFDKLGITVCQLNVEFHMNPKSNEQRRKLFIKIWKQMLTGSRFLPLHVTNAGHQRVFIVNYQDQYCREKYLERFIN